MKTIQTLILFAVMVVLSSCNGEVKTVNSLETAQDSMSYALGLDIAFKAKTSFEGTKKEQFIQGYRDGLDSTKFLINPKHIEQIISDYSKIIRKQQRLRKEEKQLKDRLVKFADNKILGEQFLSENAKRKVLSLQKVDCNILLLKKGKGRSQHHCQLLKYIIKEV